MNADRVLTKRTVSKWLQCDRSSVLERCSLRSYQFLYTPVSSMPVWHIVAQGTPLRKTRDIHKSERPPRQVPVRRTIKTDVCRVCDFDREPPNKVLRGSALSTVAKLFFSLPNRTKTTARHSGPNPDVHGESDSLGLASRFKYTAFVEGWWHTTPSRHAKPVQNVT